ncbi:hypothetical protein BDB01DRAFT_850343 [Pilobolus umbonatus]|nr:hypothetical protein BDB01DRAFT_850343 [Pilobolus umbonatus]
MSHKPIQKYPVQGLMPKQDTQASNFIKKYPKYDGRNTVIAILDTGKREDIHFDKYSPHSMYETGVDPGAAGMQITTEGKPKLVDIVDCTGAGDIDTSRVVKPTVDNGKKTITGLSGRTLMIDDGWTNPSNEYHIGLKRAYELFPNDLKSRLKAERRVNFVRKQAHLKSKEQTRLVELLKTDNYDPATKEDLEARIEELKTLSNNYEDPGMILDCVVFFDGEHWRAVVDTTETGDLRGLPCLTDYRKEFKYATFGKADLLNFSVNIYNDGNLLSIVTVSGSHGTHVAGITAGHFPDEPELDGVAPGAQLISLRIGDARLGSMETGPGLTRAASHLAMHKVDLANMSYGESSSLPKDGHFIKLLANEAIGKSGCIFVTSAGNDGPCYSSIGAPAGMDESFITVGAYVKHAQMEAEYSLLESVTERPYTWSSRGPCTDGYHGVDIYAPGSAITSVPVYVLNKMDLKNGTSMSSPNACGCIALLVSALKAENQGHTPYRLKNAVVQTAKTVEDPLNVGFLQVEKAWEYLQNYKNRDDLDIIFKTTVYKRGSQRGIYLREVDETSQIQYITTQVQPKFMGEVNWEEPKYNQSKFNYDVRVALISTQSWITVPDFLYLHSSGNSFQIKVNPLSLSESKFHFGEVYGYDTSAPDRGPLFRIPVSVVKPTLCTKGNVRFDQLSYEPGRIIRKFVQVPEGATACELTLRSHSPVETAPARFMLHLLQLIPKRNQKNSHSYSFLLGNGSFCDPMSDPQVVKKVFSVRGGLNLEICLAQFWSALGSHSVDLNLDFRGVQIAGNLSNGESTLYLEPQVTRLDISAPVRREVGVNVNVSFNKLRKYIRPQSSVISPMNPERDTLPNTRLLYQLLLTYQFKLDSATTITPRFPTVMNQLYEHFLAGVFGIVYDVNHKVIGYLDVFDHDIKISQKGEYSIVLQLSTENEEVLEKLKDTICELDSDLKSVNFNTYQTMGDVYNSNGSNYVKVELERKDPSVFYIAAPTGKDSIPKEAKPKDALVGKLNFLDKVDGGQYTAIYSIPPAPIEKNDKSSGSDNGENDLQKLKDATRDLEISYLKKMQAGSSEYTELLQRVETTYPDDISVMEFKINKIWSENKNTITECLLPSGNLPEAKCKEIVQLADKMIQQIGQQGLFAYFGRQTPSNETDEEKEIRKTNEKKKKDMIYALKNKVMAYSTQLDKQSYLDLFEKSEKELHEWSSDDSSNNLNSLLVKVRYERQLGHSGNALKAITNYLSDVALTADNHKDIGKLWMLRKELYDELKWTLWSDYDSKWTVIRQPPYGAAHL